MGLTEGNIFQGELSLEQLFFNRPVPGWARFRTPVRDLWLCGSSAHPGGGIMGAPGRIAALELLRAKRGARRVTGGRSAGMHRRRWGPQRPGLRHVPGAARACARSSWRGATRSAARSTTAEIAAGRPHAGSTPIPSAGCVGSIARDLGLVAAMAAAGAAGGPRVTSVRPDGPPITLWGDPDRTAAEISRMLSTRDATPWPGFDAEVRAHARGASKS